MTGTADVLAAARHMLGAAVPEEFLADWPASCQPSRRPAPHALPVLAFLPACTAEGQAADLVRHIKEAAIQWAWRQTYAAGQADPAFLVRYGWAELIGRNGPVASDSLACGVLLLGPDTLYPRHSHEAEEIYLPLAGAAWWQRGVEPWQRRPPGTPIHHPSGVPHAMRTEAHALLALYLWRGPGLEGKSRLEATAPAASSADRRAS